MTNLHKAITAAGSESALARAVLDSMPSPFSSDTPVQEEVAAEITRGEGFFALGTVVQTLDEQRAGRILVSSPAFPEGPQTCDYISPIAGAGYGFFAVPGIGATVLIGKTSFGDPPSQNFWLGCLYATGQRQIHGLKAQPYKFGDPEQYIKNEIDDSADPIQMSPAVSYGVPNEQEVYRDNDLPDSFILKHPAGHSISLTDKHSPERQINEVKLKSAGNKRLILSDAPAAAGGENILLIDENENQIKITSTAETADKNDSIITESKGNIETTSKEGNSIHTIGADSAGDYSITNIGTGNIDISSNQGHITLLAATSITLTCGDSTITMTPEGINITAPEVNIDGVEAGDVLVQGISLRQHKHLGNLGAPTSIGGM